MRPKYIFAMRRTLLIAVLGYGLCTLLLAQEDRIAFHHLSTDHGLLSNTVFAIAQDEQGYLWIGTAHGLQRYDGRRFLNFRANPDQPHLLPSHVIGGLQLDAANRLWVLSQEGHVGIFDTRKLYYRAVDVYSGSRRLSRLQSARLLTDDRGNVFLLDTAAGLLVWDEDQQRFQTCALPAPAKPDWRLKGFAHRPGTDEYFLSFGERGLYRCQVGPGGWAGTAIRLERLTLPDLPANAEAYHLHVDRQDRLWLQYWPVGDQLRVYAYDLLRQRVLLRQFTPTALTGTYLVAQPFFEDYHGRIWLYGGGILSYYDEAKQSFELVRSARQRENRSIQYRTVSTLFSDREQTLWLATTDNGIFTFHPGREFFRSISHQDRQRGQPGTGSPTDFVELDDGSILVSVWGDGLYRYDRQWNELPLPADGPDELLRHSIWSMAPSARAGLIWLVTQSGRLLRYDQRSGQARVFRADSLEGRTIRQVVEDHRGDLWLGLHHHGVYRWRVSGEDGIPAPQPERFAAIPRGRVSKLIVDDRGWVWASTEGQGLYAIDPVKDQVVRHFHPQQSDPALRLAQVGVSSVLAYSDSLIIISGAADVYGYQPWQHRLRRLLPRGAMAGYIAELARDRSGYLWVATSSGLYRVNIRTGALLAFGRRDGIEDENFTVAASASLRDGQLLFGASEQFVAFDPQAFSRPLRDSATARITELYVNNRPLLVDSVEAAGELRLGYRESSLSLVFSTLQFPRGQHIRYRLEGLDADWQQSEQQMAVYAHLPPGSYRFMLQPVYADGTLGRIRELRIVRNPAFWQTWWFYSLLGLAIGWIVYLFDRERRYRRETLRQMREKVADNLHTEIRTALNSIHILSEIAGVKSKKNPVVAIDYLDQIKGKSQRMMVAMEDILWSLAPENDNVEKVVDRIADYVHQLNTGGHASIDLLVEPEIGNLRLEMNQRQSMLRLFRETTESLLKAGATHQQVYLGRRKNHLAYTVEFDKTGMDMNVFTNLMQRRELAALLEKLGAEQQLEIHRTRGFLSFSLLAEPD